MTNSISILKELKQKFGENLDKSLDDCPNFEEIEIKNRSFYYLGEILGKSRSETHKQISLIFNEIFSDLTVATYLVHSAINNPAKILLRRVLELGISILFFWDLPHKFWGWKNINEYETDLHFSENLNYLSSLGYKEYLINEYSIDNWHVDKDELNELYRQLSNTIHGKHITFTSNFEDYYSFSKKEFQIHESLILSCQNLILRYLECRFPKEFIELQEKNPALQRFDYDCKN